MIQLVQLLFGDEATRLNAKYLAGIATLWGLLGFAIALDGLENGGYFPIEYVGSAILLESLVTFMTAIAYCGMLKQVLFFKAMVFCLISLLILLNDKVGNLLMAIFFSILSLLVGLFTLIAACIVRHPTWRGTAAWGVGHCLLAAIILMPYPTHYKATFSFYIGSLMISGSLRTVLWALRILGYFADHSLILRFFSSKGSSQGEDSSRSRQDQCKDGIMRQSDLPLVIHIWTPVGSATGPTKTLPVISRYIAAIDTHGMISTGHAALELGSDIYISLYPMEDIDRTPATFFKTLRATRENDVPGFFQNDYVHEVSQWCDSDRQVRFHHYNRPALEAFWNDYQQNKAYNLTSRNCSSSVASALEAALNGALSVRYGRGIGLLRMLAMPELWIAAQIRQRALSMAWTPGLVMDYAVALHSLIYAVQRPLYPTLFSALRFFIWQRKNTPISDRK